MPLSNIQLVRLSTLQQFQNFRDSTIHTDLQNEILLWIDDIQAQLEVAENYDSILRLQGNAKACRNLLTLVDIIISQMEAERE